MGLSNDEGRFAYVNIKKGLLAIKRGDEYVTFKHLEGYITDVDIREDEYQGKKYQKLCVNVHDGNENFQLQMRFDSGYARAFCAMIENVDLREKVKISPALEEKNGKEFGNMFMNQNKKPIKWKYTNDHPLDRPDIEKVPFKDQVLIDNSKQRQFYYEIIMHKIKSQLTGANELLAGPRHQLNEKANQLPEPNSITEPIDDLPF